MSNTRETATNITVQSMLIKDTADIKLLTVFEIFAEGGFPCPGHRKKKISQFKNQSRCVTLELRAIEEETYAESKW